MAKMIDMILNIKAVFSGGAFNALSGALGKVHNHVRKVSLSFKDLALSLGAVAIGYKAFEGIGSFFKDAIQTARNYQTAQDRLGLALNKNKILMKMGPGVIADQKTKLEGLAASMEKTGYASEILLAGFAGLATAKFGPKAIKENAEGFQGLIFAMKGANATMDDAKAVALSVQGAIKTGLLRPFTQAKLVTQAQIKEWTKLKTEMGRANFMQKLMGQQSGKLAAWMQTDAGRIWKSQQVWGRIKSALGKPFIKTQLVWAETMGKVGAALEPVANKLAQVLEPALQKFGRYIEEQQPIIDQWGKKLVEALQWIFDHGDVVAKAVTAIGIAFGTWGLIALVNPLTLIVVGLAAIAAVALTVSDNWDKIGPAVSDAWDAINTNFIQPVTNALKPIWEPIVQGASEIWGKISGPLGNVVDKVGALFTSKKFLNPATGSYERIQGQWGELKTAAKEAIDAVSTTFAEYDYAKLVTNVYKGIIAAIKGINWADVGKTLVDLLTQAISNALTFAGALASAFFNWIKLGFANIGPLILGELKNVIANTLKKPPSAAEIELAQRGLEAGKLGAGAPSKLKEELPAIKTQTEEVKKKGIETSSVFSSWSVTPLLNQLDQVAAKASAAAAAVSAASAAVPKTMSPWSSAPTGQYGGLMTRPTIIGEAGPEMAIPMKSTARSKSLLAAAARLIGIDLDKINVGGTNLGRMLEGMDFGPMNTAKQLGAAQQEIFRRAQGSSGGMNVSMNAPITVNGVSSGQAGAVGKEVEKAMLDTTKQLLEQLRRAREEERRTAYV